ncbi:MAG: hypothetical protein ACYC7E_19665 [Armatimonadota bacterium]
MIIGSARTEFSLFDGRNDLRVQVRSTGVFLTEAGQAGTLQQVDLATQPVEQESAQGAVAEQVESQQVIAS